MRAADAAAEAASGLVLLKSAIDCSTGAGAGADPSAAAEEEEEEGALGEAAIATDGGTVLCLPVEHPQIS
jgi:hypothetical protein